MEKATHTPEPWYVAMVAEHAYPATITDGDGEILIAKTCGLDTFKNDQNCDQENANARRIVACVNACAGIETENLENAGRLPDGLESVQRRIDELKSENGRLRNALQGIIEIGKRNMENPKYDGYFDAARAALSETAKPAEQ